ncbi:MAG TPA: tagaturonate epimerase family protein [Kiritimatiellia bacterium]|nr:tagaturonate epimerase family protein [Kiritimatiellia bacterium]
MKTLPALSFGMGDRFARQGVAQLGAIQTVARAGVPLCPVWNKSNREHSIIGTQPRDLRAEADHAVRALDWRGPYFVDADHINIETVDRFLAACDFFTLDVADYVGRPADAAALAAFVAQQDRLVGEHALPRGARLSISRADVERTASKFLWAMQEAGRIHRRIAAARAPDSFAIEVSVDETDAPQTPGELLIILAMIAAEGIPAQTIAPKFTGRFNKGVDYVGDIDAFEREFDADLAVLAFAVERFGLPPGLKISVHSGSDKFSLYPIIRRLIARHDAGLHIKTAGTTWLEEVIGLAEAGGEALGIAKEIYARALPRAEALIQPYKPVVDIELGRLPSVETVQAWSSDAFVAALSHDAGEPRYDRQFRQFIHVSFKIAAELGAVFTDALEAHREIVGRRVRDNLLVNHMTPLFL